MSTNTSTLSTPYSTRPSTPTTAALPAILCLHGGGTSALIFKIQLRNLLSRLRSHFRLIFLDAPYPSAAGPNVLPAFADVGPYYRWMPAEDYSSHSKGGVDGGVREQEEGARRARAQILNVIREGRARGEGEVVGVLGFSQGGRMAAGLLADQEEGRAAVEMPRFAFGVLLCASYPPYSLANAAKAPPTQGVLAQRRDEHGTLVPPRPDEVIYIPSVHVRGLVDPHLEKGRRLARYFAGEEKEEEDEDGGQDAWSGYGYGDGNMTKGKKPEVTKVELEFEMGHHLPQAAGDVSSGGKAATKEIVDAILRVSEGVRQNC
ncbi:MAG: hypothetical protein Q9163_006328 [Psora crenata]